MYQQAGSTALQHFETDEVTHYQTQQSIEYWQQWCEDKIRHFQRSSSAVEGRNGCLAQMYHNRRGQSETRLKALTVIHNYGTYRADGSTPASRLYEQEFPNLFEWLLGEMGALPLPRKPRIRKKSNPLIQKECPTLNR